MGAHDRQTVRASTLVRRILLILLAAIAATAVPLQRPVATTDNRFVVYVRTFHDAPFLDLWVRWYHMLGFYIVMLNTGPVVVHPLVKRAYERIMQLPRLQIHSVPNAGNDALGEHLHYATSVPGAEWVLMVDMDEFLVLDQPTIHEHVDALQSQYGQLDAVQFRWAMMESVERGCPTKPLGDFVRQSSIKPWSYLKTMTRATAIASVPSPHYPLLHEHLVPQARVLCDGRLFVSQHPMINRTITWAPFSQSALLHLRTRSLIDMLVKATNTRLNFKTVRSKDTLGSVLNAERVETKQDRARLLKRFVAAVGIKAMQPIRTACDSRLKAAVHSLSNFTVRTMRKRLYRLLAVQEDRMQALGAAYVPMCDQWLEYRVFAAETLGRLGVEEEAFMRSAHWLSLAFRDRMSAIRGIGCDHVQLAYVSKHLKGTASKYGHKKLRSARQALAVELVAPDDGASSSPP